MPAMSSNASTLLPIFFMHGIMDNHKEFDAMSSWIRAHEPQAWLASLVVSDDLSSFSNSMWEQGDLAMRAIRNHVAADPEIFQGGYTLVCHSQGALNCRTLIQRMDDHNVHTLISMAGPQLGQFGIPAGLQKIIPTVRDVGYELLYSTAFQKNLSFANYWHDPRPTQGFPLRGHPLTAYLDGNTFLPVLNNDPRRGTQGPGGLQNASEAARYKRNMLRLRNSTFMIGDADDTIIPWQSAVWGFYAEQEWINSSSIVPLQASPLWSDDWLGLRALSQSGRMQLIVAPGVEHTDWSRKQEVFEQYVWPRLPRAKGRVQVGASRHAI